MILERRSVAERPEFATVDGRLVASGVAVPYDSRSKVLTSGDRGAFRERIMPGAARKTLQEQDVFALHEHDMRNYLARTSNGTLRLVDDDTALRYEIDLPDTSTGRDVAALLERGDVRGASIGFVAIEARTDWTVEDGMALRTIRELRLRDVSTTTNPAYAATSADVALRSAGEDLIAVAEAGHLAELISLRDAHCTIPELDDQDDDGREGTVARPRVAWLYT